MPTLTPIKINAKDGTYTGTANHTKVIQHLAQQAAKQKIEASGAAVLTDSSGGTNTGGLIKTVAAFVDAAASGSDLADQTTSNAVLTAVKDAVKEISTKANAYAGLLGTSTVTDSGGGTAADGTIGAIAATVTGAATGIKATETNIVRLALEDAFVELTSVVNKLAVAAGLYPVTLNFTPTASKNGTIGVITVATGTAATPGVKKSVFDAACVVYRDNVAVLAAKLNEIKTASAQRIVVVNP